MKHLTDAELVDLLDAASRGLPADRLRHLESCDACRLQAEALRAALAETLTDQAPEPSPLFWDYFAARVSDAVRHESPGAADAASSFPALRQRPLAQWALAASIAVLMMMAVLWRATLHAPAPAGPPVMTVAHAPRLDEDTTASDVATPDDVEKDEAWAVVRTAAEGFRWEDAHAVGITAHPGAAEGLALELNDDERAELARLIDSEMKRTGA
jgi:hypothetical protein